MPFLSVGFVFEKSDFGQSHRHNLRHIVGLGDFDGDGIVSVGGAGAGFAAPRLCEPLLLRMGSEYGISVGLPSPFSESDIVSSIVGVMINRLKVYPVWIES
ncbi:hypothetical protein ACN38_g13128 [Penicillium nordicum]|uniref:Uncharacterized protein n=1 Tax=Penicillium nordicum TaxID=229535 RepID=A0A0M8NX86_9EURO|nr:hypothetical protein ACN38_g13128 [Penicillium nordicum]